MMHDCNWPAGFMPPPPYSSAPPPPPEKHDQELEELMIERLRNVSSKSRRLELVEELFSSALKNPDLIFKDVTDRELAKRERIFKIMNDPLIFRSASGLLLFAIKLRLPLHGLIKNTIFSQFCGGGDLDEALQTANKLCSRGVGALLDRAVEACSTQQQFDHSLASHQELISALASAPSGGMCALKISSLCDAAVLENPQASAASKASFARAEEQVLQLANLAQQSGVKLMIDAEESWLQDSIDQIASAAMRAVNRDRATVYTTIQMYRSDRIELLSELLDCEDYVPGIKLVRGAYLEAETLRAARQGVLSPIYQSKEQVDSAYNHALEIVISRLDRAELMVATHNRNSCLHALKNLIINNLELAHPNIRFAQLYGMSDDLTAALGRVGVSVAKYLPYGAVNESIPYLVRRAQENSAVIGETSRELRLVQNEIYRRSYNRLSNNNGSVQ